MPEETIEEINRRDAAKKRGTRESVRSEPKKKPKKIRTDEDRKRNLAAVKRFQARQKGTIEPFIGGSKMGHTPIPEGYVPFPLKEKLRIEKGLEEVCAIVAPIMAERRAQWEKENQDDIKLRQTPMV